MNVIGWTNYVQSVSNQYTEYELLLLASNTKLCESSSTSIWESVCRLNKHSIYSCLSVKRSPNWLSIFFLDPFHNDETSIMSACCSCMILSATFVRSEVNGSCGLGIELHCSRSPFPTTSVSATVPSTPCQSSLHSAPSHLQITLSTQPDPLRKTPSCGAESPAAVRRSAAWLRIPCRRWLRATEPQGSSRSWPGFATNSSATQDRICKHTETSARLMIP